MKKGLLLLNLGTPDSAEPADVGKYLREFLMDPLVVDIARPLRWLLVQLAIVPRRSHASAALYKKIWTDRGSPLLFHTSDLTEKIRNRLRAEWAVDMGMRYGKPTTRAALERLRAQGVESLLAVPLYPQYSLAATQSSMNDVRDCLKKMGWAPALRFLPPFYDDPRFIGAFTEAAGEILKRSRFDFVVFSFHGLPERQVKKTDASGTHCEFSSACCHQIVEFNRDCYRAQCFVTAEKIATGLGLDKTGYTVGFQSRLGRTPWIKPWSDEIYRELAAKGLKRVAVISPSFVADCLETLEEIAIRGKEDFIRHGGEDLVLIPSLNSRESWVEALAAMIRE